MTLSYLVCELSNVGVIPLGRTGEHNATRVIMIKLHQLFRLIFAENHLSKI